MIILKYINGMRFCHITILLVAITSFSLPAEELLKVEKSSESENGRVLWELSLFNSYYATHLSSDSDELLFRSQYAIGGSLGFLFITPEAFPVDFYADIGYSAISYSPFYGSTRSRGFSNFAFKTGIDIPFSDVWGIRGGVEADFSQYTDTKIFFSHMQAHIIPYYAILFFTSKTDNSHRYSAFQSISLVFPISWDIRRDLAFSGSIGIGFRLSVHPPPSRKEETL